MFSHRIWVKGFPRHIWAGIFVIFAAFSHQVFGATENRVQSIALNPTVRVLDGQWQGIISASDGNCYFASSTHAHNHGATFWKFDPKTEKATLLAEDISRICGENPTNQIPQGKIHSPIIEFEGWLYFATHISNEWPEAIARYTGAHVVAYNMATGQFRDYGVIRNNHSIYSAIGLDRTRRKLYIFTSPFYAIDGAGTGSHIYRLDIDTGAKQSLGLVATGLQRACFWMFVDKRGDCWFTVREDGGALQKVNGATGVITRYPNVLPESGGPNWRFWGWAHPMPDGDKCLVTIETSSTTTTGWLYSFDSARFATNPATAFTRVADIGPTYLNLTYTSNQVYYIQRANRQAGHQNVNDHHLMSVTLNGTPVITDHGLIKDQSGRQAMRIPSLATDGKGRLFMVGDWYTIAGDMGSLRYNSTTGTYSELNRAQFFAHQNFGPPALVIQRKTNDQSKVDFSWPSSAAGFQLQQRGTFNPDTWTSVSNSVLNTNGRSTVTIPIQSTSNQFFRLRKEG